MGRPKEGSRSGTRKRGRARSIAPCTLAVVALAAGCRGEAENERPLEVVVPTAPENLDPRFSVDPTGLRITRLVHASLVRLDPDSLAPEPYLAKSWSWRDPRTLDVELRRDVRFHGGKPLDASDVVATVRAFGSPSVGSFHAPVVRAIARVEPRGHHTVRIHLDRPRATLLTDLELPILRADQAMDTSVSGAELDGLGPFVIESRDRSMVELTPAPHGAGPHPKHAVTFRAIRDENARVMRMRAGRGDIMVDGLSPSLLRAVSGQSGLEVSERPGANLTYLLLNNARAPMSDARLRQAVDDTIDRRGITRYLYADRATPTRSLVPRDHWAHMPEPDSNDSARPERARMLLGGEHPTIDILTSTDRLRMVTARAIAQGLRDAGFVVRVSSFEIGTLLARLSDGNFDAAILQIPELTEPHVLSIFLHSRAIPPNGANRSRVRDSALDALLDRGGSVRSPGERRAIYAEVTARVRQGRFILPLWHEAHVTVTSPRARAFSPSAEGRYLGLASLP